MEVDRTRSVGPLVRVSAAAGFVFGTLSVIAGTRVLAGVDRPDYVVLPWLVGYNVAAGIAAAVAGAGLWWLRSWAVWLARTLAVLHGAVLILLLGRLVSGGSVAVDSVMAMLIRAALWGWIAVVTSRARRPTAGRAPVPSGR